MPEFVFIDSSINLEPGARSAVRSQAMRDFRRRQRLERKNQARYEALGSFHSVTESGVEPSVGSSTTNHRITRSNSPGATAADAQSNAFSDRSHSQAEKRIHGRDMYGTRHTIESRPQDAQTDYDRFHQVRSLATGEYELSAQVGRRSSFPLRYENGQKSNIAGRNCDDSTSHVGLDRGREEIDASAGANSLAGRRSALRRAVYARQEPLTSLPKSLTSSSYRLCMRDAFCHLFYPEGRSGTYDLFHQIHPASWAERLTLDASDALCTLQVAISHANREMLHLSLKLHDSALQRLQTLISWSLRSSSTSSLVGAVYYLLKWESLMATSWDSVAWQYHCGALLKFLSQKNIEEHNKDPKLPGFLSFAFCYVVGTGLLSRKSVPWASIFQQEQSQLISIALQVPPCLSILDAARDSSSQPGQVKAAIEQALLIRQGLSETIAKYSSSSEGDMSLYTVDISRYPDVEAAIGSDIVKLYASVYLFSSFEVGVALKTLWTSLLVLDRALSDLQQQQRHEPNSREFDAYNLRQLEIEIEMDECADNICRTLPYFARPECKSSGALCVMEPLHFLQNHFEIRNAMRHLEWCRAFKDAMVPGYKITRMLEG